MTKPKGAKILKIKEKKKKRGNILWETFKQFAPRGRETGWQSKNRGKKTQGKGGEG